MTKIFVLSIAVLLIAGMGCVSSSITVLEKKEPARLYEKILVIYVDEGCEFTIFDSTTYNICLRSCFLNGGNMELRRRVEGEIASNLVSKGSTVLKSSDMLDTRTNTYADFNRLIDRHAIEVLLLVDFHRFSHTESQAQPTGNYQNGLYIPNTPMHYKALGAAYGCYLIDAKTSALPFWKAEIGLKGKIGAGKNGLNRGMARQLGETLKSSGYIAR